MENASSAASAIAQPTEELALAVGVFTIVALLIANYPKVGKPLAAFILIALAVRAAGTIQAGGSF